MEIRQDRSEFERRQFRLLKDIASGVKQQLENAGLPPQTVEEVTGTITFSVASILDDGGAVSAARPVMAFADEGTRVLMDPGGTWMHEVAFSLVEDLFDHTQPGNLSKANGAKAVLYCTSKGITVSPAFGRNYVARFAVIRGDSKPPKLIAATWDSLEDVRGWLEKSVRPELGDKMLESILVLDLKEGRKISLTSSWGFSPGVEMSADDWKKKE